MITRKEYLIALDTVESYHNQLNLQISSSSIGGKTTIESWILQNRSKCSTRIINIITSDNIRISGSKNLECGFKYIDDITEKTFCFQRNAGKKAWKEFSELRGY